MEFLNKFKLKYIHPVFVLLLFTVLIFLLEIHLRTILDISFIVSPLAKEIIEGLIISFINAGALYIFIFRPGWMPMNERKQAQENLLKAYGELEKRVEERTQDLARVNTNLQNEIRERKLAEQKLEGKSQLQEVLNSMLSISMEPHYLPELLDKVLEQIVTVSWLALGARAAIFLASDTESDVLVMKSSVEFPESVRMICERVPFGKCICGLAAQTGMVQYVPSVDERHSINYAGMEPHGHYCVPIRQSSNKVLGVICLYLKEDYVQKIEDQNFIVSIANVLAGIIERKGAEMEVHNYRQKLEYLVEERTQEIVKINEQLKNDILKRKHVEEKLQKSLDKLRAAMGGTVSAIALTVEMRDPYTAGHQKRVSNLARAIATKMGLSEFQIDGIRMAGHLHDLGKISIPAEILSKPGKLTALEFSMVKNHPQLGYEILKQIEFPWPVAQIVLQHHERINGQGYPLGLTDKDILIEAKILAVADVVEAIASHRPYRPALGMDYALEDISKNRGILYDPTAVDMCIKLIREGFNL